MITMEYKGGIGTSSRVLAGLGTIGVLVLANFGGRRQLRVGGVPVGRVLDDEQAVEDPARGDAGSCIGIVHHRHPPRLAPAHPRRPARRARARARRQRRRPRSGDIFCAVSVGHRVPRFTTGLVTSTLLADDDIGPLFAATVDATEEAVTNALFVADTVVGRDGNTAPGLRRPVADAVAVGTVLRR